MLSRCRQDAKPDNFRLLNRGKMEKQYKGNFIRRSGRVRNYFVSTAINSEAKKAAKLVIMAKQ